MRHGRLCHKGAPVATPEYDWTLQGANVPNLFPVFVHNLFEHSLSIVTTPPRAASQVAERTRSNMLTLRLRSRDGLERIQAEPASTVSQLKDLVSKLINHPPANFVLSADQALVRPRRHQSCLRTLVSERS